MKRKAAYDVPSTEKEKTLNLSYRPNAASSAEHLETLPSNFQDTLSEGLRKIDLSNQVKLNVGQLNLLRFAGETLTWVNLSGVPIGEASGWATWMRMCRTLLGT